MSEDNPRAVEGHTPPAPMIVETRRAVPAHPAPTDEKAVRAQVAANDNGSPAEIQSRFDAAVLKIARLIGRQIAREEFVRGMAEAANDNFYDPTNPDGGNV